MTGPVPPRPRVRAQRPDARSTRTVAADEGFTLIELIIVVAIIPLIVGALAVSLISVFSLQNATASRLNDTADSQVVASYFIGDVQSSAQVTSQALTTSSCGNVSGTQLLAMQWSGSAGNYQTTVSYVEVQQPDGTYVLERLACTNGSVTPSSTTIIASDLANPSQESACINLGDLSSTCAVTSGWEVSNLIALVRLTVNEPKSSYTYTLQATPRAWTPASGGGAGIPFAPITLLGPCSGSGTTGSSLTLAQNSSLTVNQGSGYGLIAVGSTCPNSVLIDNGATMNVAGVATANQYLNSVTTQSGSVSTIPEDPGSNLTDPFSTTMTAPSGPAGTAVPSSTLCTESLGVWYCNPGNYADDPTTLFGNSATVDFFPGNYWFQAGLNMVNNLNVTFGTGTYVFYGSSTVLSNGPGTNNAIDGTGGVLFYAPNGWINLANNANVNLTALPGENGVTIWDASSTTDASGCTVSLGNNGSLGFSYGGIYVPKGVLCDTQNGTMGASFVVAGSMQISNNVSIVVNYSSGS